MDCRRGKLLAGHAAIMNALTLEIKPVPHLQFSQI